MKYSSNSVCMIICINDAQATGYYVSFRESHDNISSLGTSLNANPIEQKNRITFETKIKHLFTIIK